MRLIIVLCLLTLFSCKTFTGEKTDDKNVISQKEQEEFFETLSSEGKNGVVDGNATSTSNKEDRKLPLLNHHVQEMLEDSCVAANSIRKEIVLYLKDSFYQIMQDDFIAYLKDNVELDKLDCSFPRNNDELLLLYHFTEKLESGGDFDAINIIINLDLYMSRVTEYAEHMHDVIPRLSLINTLWFIKSIHDLSEKNQAAVLENLEYLVDIQAVEKLRSNLLEIKEPKYQLTISLANESIDRIFE
ncbi:MAG: hypothetical protein WAU36_10395 [Cyclobacteriaceae bacterium]